MTDKRTWLTRKTLCSFWSATSAIFDVLFHYLAPVSLRVNFSRNFLAHQTLSPSSLRGKKTSCLAHIQEEDILSPLGKLKNQDKDNHSSFKAKIYLKGYSLWQSLSCIVVRGQEPKLTPCFVWPLLDMKFYRDMSRLPPSGRNCVSTFVSSLIHCFIIDLRWKTQGTFLWCLSSIKCFQFS